MANELKVLRYYLPESHCTYIRALSESVNPKFESRQPDASSDAVCKTHYARLDRTINAHRQCSQAFFMKLPILPEVSKSSLHRDRSNLKIFLLNCYT